MKTNFYGPILTFLIGLSVLSIGLNIIFYNRINNLDKIVIHTMSPVSEKELSDLTTEINRLSNMKYDTKTKQPIKNDFINAKE